MLAPIESLADGDLFYAGPSRIVMVESVRPFRDYGRNAIAVHGRMLDTDGPQREKGWLLAHLVLDVDTEVQVVTAECPECGETAVPRVTGYARCAWAVGMDPQRLAWSHTDGEPLCHVVGPGGYVPAFPALSTATDA